MTEPDAFAAYLAPASQDRPPSPPAPGGDGLALLALWERLRIAYNAVLTAEVVVLALPAWRTLDGRFVVMLVMGCLGANVCFCAGPVANAYARWIGLRHPAVTWGLFCVGMVLSMGLTLLMVIGWGMAQMD